jgi:ABC-type oligopeptide transport system ATPase subunit
MTGPILGIISSVFLYKALIRQTESNNNQKTREESDMILSLLQYLLNEINSFYSKKTISRYEKVNNEQVLIHEEKRFYGVEALNEFTSYFRYEVDHEFYEGTFKDFFEANMLRLIMRSYVFIELKIHNSSISEQAKGMLEEKLHSIFDCILLEPFW